MPQKQFGDELERLRKLLCKKTNEHWSQKRVAERVGVTAQAYQNWTHGRRGKDIDLETLKKLADVLNGDFRRLVKLVRPDILEYCNELAVKPGSPKTAELPDEVASLFDILLSLYNRKAKAFYAIKRLILDLYPFLKK